MVLLAVALALTTIVVQSATTGALSFSKNRFVTGLAVIVAQSVAVAALASRRKQARG